MGSPKGIITIQVSKGDLNLVVGIGDGLKVDTKLLDSYKEDNDMSLQVLILEGFDSMGCITNAIIALKCKGYEVQILDYLEITNEEDS